MILNGRVLIDTCLVFRAINWLKASSDDGSRCLSNELKSEWARASKESAQRLIVDALLAVPCTNSPQKIAEIAVDALFGKVEK